MKKNWVRWWNTQWLKFFCVVSGVWRCLVVSSPQQRICKPCCRVWGDWVPLKKSPIAGSGLNPYRWAPMLQGLLWKSSTKQEKITFVSCVWRGFFFCQHLDGGWSNHPEQSHWNGRKPKTRLTLPDQSGSGSKAANLVLIDRSSPDVDKAPGDGSYCREMTNRQEGYLALTRLCWCFTGLL